MSDQDYDGSHIKGLILNLFAAKFPGLIKTPGFVQEFITPIIKAGRGGLPGGGATEERVFFTVPEFKKWYEQHGGRGWHVKYYKGGVGWHVCVCSCTCDISHATCICRFGYQRTQ